MEMSSCLVAMTSSKISTSNLVNGQNSKHWWHHRLDSSSRRPCRMPNWVTGIAPALPYPKSTVWQCRRPAWFPCWKSPPQSWAWTTPKTCCARTSESDWFYPRRNLQSLPLWQSVCGFTEMPSLGWTGWLPWTIADLLTFLTWLLSLMVKLLSRFTTFLQ